MVAFKPGTLQTTRAAIIQRIQGVVIGGMRGEGSDGHYTVRLPADSTNDRVVAALADLGADPAVSSAGVLGIMVGRYIVPAPDGRLSPRAQTAGQRLPHAGARGARPWLAPQLLRSCSYSGIWCRWG